ncbi:hypothetical protein BDF14DRAFT_1728222 [Spinellus fusiger]|nr:hypothetical protein BDF14DRAFT_1728222 [Spinellus fusiger]
MENTLEKYKRKVEEMSELKRQIKALEDQNTSLLERSHQVEDEYRKVLAFKTLMDSYKEQVHQLEMGNREILKEKTRLDTELRGLSETCTYLENDRDRAIEQVQLLEEHIKEMEFSGNVVIDEGLDSEHNTMEENMDDNKPTTLDQVKLTEFKAIEQAKKQLETFTTVLNERDQLRQELAQIRNGIPDSLLNQTQTIMAFRSRILDLEKESTFLRESTSQLETTVLEGTRSVAKDGTSLQQFEMEQTKIQDRLNRLEDITKMQLHDINRMLVEANYLNGVNNQPEEEFSRGRPGMSDKDLEIIKEENANLQIHVLHLQEEINETQGKIRKVRDMVKLYNQLFQEMTVRFGSANGRDENGGLLGRAPRTKEEEHDLLKKQIHDVRLQSRREQQLIISAWYDLARRHHRDTTSLSNRSTPSSWLGRQRKILDGQLRQRLC